MPMPELENLSCARGAPMGRSETHDGDREDPAKFYLQYVPFVDGCYDRGGAYWGMPADLYRAYAEYVWEGNTLITEMFVRASSRDNAKAKVREMYPNAKFFR